MFSDFRQIRKVVRTLFAISLGRTACLHPLVYHNSLILGRGRIRSCSTVKWNSSLTYQKVVTMIEILLSIWFVSIVTATVLGERKNHEVSGLLYGIFFGPLGILMAWLLPYKPVPGSDRRVIIVKVIEEKDESRETQ